MEVKVCIGSACHLKGSNEVIQEFQRVIKEYDLEQNIRLKGSFCLNHCTDAVSVQVDDNPVISMSVNKVKDLIAKLAGDIKWNI